MSIYIITGGEGFIGSKITRKVNGQSYDLKSGLDILNTSLFAEHATGMDGIFHCAAKISVPESIAHPDEYHRTNVEGTQSVVSTAKKNNTKMVFSSSAAVYGTSEDVVTEESSTDPMSPYAQNKLDGEKIIRDANIPAVVLRYFNVYGPGQSIAYAGVIATFIQKALKGEDLLIHGDGKQTRDFVYVEDVVEANVLAMKYTKKPFDTFNIASGDSITILEIA
ncbi:MAG: hypothetical protein RJB39_468, partial [Candidatus Parcubacteria bacterium]